MDRRRGRRLIGPVRSQNAGIKFTLGLYQSLIKNL